MTNTGEGEGVVDVGTISASKERVWDLSSSRQKKKNKRKFTEILLSCLRCFAYFSTDMTK